LVDENYNVKIADFGLARFKTTKNEASLAKLRGAPLAVLSAIHAVWTNARSLPTKRHVRLCCTRDLQRRVLHHQVRRLQLWDHPLGNGHTCDHRCSSQSHPLVILLIVITRLTLGYPKELISGRMLSTSTSSLTSRSSSRRPRRDSGTNRQRLRTRSRAHSFANTRRPTIPAGCPLKWAELIKRCWSQAPADRPHFEEILKALAELKSATHIKSEVAFHGV